MADEKRSTANDTQYYYDVKNEKIENTIQNYFWSGAGMIEVRKYLT